MQLKLIICHPWVGSVTLAQGGGASGGADGGGGDGSGGEGGGGEGEGEGGGSDGGGGEGARMTTCETTGPVALSTVTPTAVLSELVRIRLPR